MYCSFELLFLFLFLFICLFLFTCLFCFSFLRCCLFYLHFLANFGTLIIFCKLFIFIYLNNLSFRFRMGHISSKFLYLLYNNMLNRRFSQNTFSLLTLLFAKNIALSSNSISDRIYMLLHDSRLNLTHFYENRNLPLYFR